MEVLVIVKKMGSFKGTQEKTVKGSLRPLVKKTVIFNLNIKIS